ncbi:hypothetical protein [Myceligenerans indicum]|uniref:Uncharacterized protein n=1 Tax=Myceligenerans indicum TaxID=2593663 RepID=A0ABS1LHI0_9MICO|nr:hypothetical protein [Myceligenerans indicum]MBL0885685.1 hypothetical protein [Myceligenerans indicum]
MVTEAGESQTNGSDAGTETDWGELTASNAEQGDESLASYARIAPRPPKRRPTRREVLGGGDATKAPKRLAAGELHPMTGDSSGVSWDDPEEL